MKWSHFAGDIFDEVEGPFRSAISVTDHSSRTSNKAKVVVLRTRKTEPCLALFHKKSWSGVFSLLTMETLTIRIQLQVDSVEPCLPCLRTKQTFPSCKMNRMNSGHSSIADLWTFVGSSVRKLVCAETLSVRVNQSIFAPSQ